MNCPLCNKTFEPTTHNNKFCSVACRKYRSGICACGKVIPLSITINGEQKNLQNRTKCLECLPWNPRKILTPEQRTESNKIKCASYYEATKELQNKQSAARIAALIVARKQSIVDLIGGCQICGYSKNLRNIAFHHLRDKRFNISGNCFAHAKAKLAEELSKCICLCHMCHGEAHDDEFDETLVSRLNAEFAQAISVWVEET